MALEPTLSWVVALAVITVVVSCCVLYSIRQVFSLTERVNRSQQAVSEMQDLQTQVKQLSDFTKDQAKRLAEETAAREREQQERLANNDTAQNEQMYNRLENLERGLLDHEMKVEDAVSRAMSAEAKVGAGGHRGGIAGLGDLESGGRGALDLSVADFATLMHASKGIDPSILFPQQQQSAAAAARGSSSPSSSSLHTSFSAPTFGGGGGSAYTPSPQFQALLDHGSLRDQARNYSPSGGLFAHAPSQQQSPSNNSAAVAKNQYLRGNSNNPNASSTSTPQTPPAFWVYEATAGSGGLRRRLHSVTFIAGESPTERASLVLRFDQSEAVSAKNSDSAAVVVSMGGSSSGGGGSKGVPADGAGPGVTAIPLPSITLIDVSFANNREVVDSFSNISVSPVVLIRVEHRGVLGEWSVSRETTREREVTDRAAAGGGFDVSSNRPPQQQQNQQQLGRPFSRQRLLERASNVASVSARGAASTSFSFFVPLRPELRAYLDFLQRVLPNAVVMDERSDVLAAGSSEFEML